MVSREQRDLRLKGRWLNVGAGDGRGFTSSVSLLWSASIMGWVMANKLIYVLFCLATVKTRLDIL